MRAARPMRFFAPYTMTASILGATVSPNPDVIANRLGRCADRAVVHDHERFRCIHRSRGRLDVRQRESRHAHDRRRRNSKRTTSTVTAGSTSLRATIGGTSDAAADLDLFVFNCTTGTCVLAGQAADGDSEESVTIANPAAGAWRVSGRWLQRPGRDHDVQLHRCVRECSVRVSAGHRCERAAAGGRVRGTSPAR